jgi:hypothetical protein
VEAVGYIFGYATLADAADRLVVESRIDAEPVYGHIEGYRRRWNAGMENRAPLNDRKHYVDSATGERLDICVVALNVQPGDGRVNGVAVPVSAQALPAFDRRELHYDRIDVSAAFTERVGLPIWTYTGNDQALADYRAAHERGRAFIRRTYAERVDAVFRELGERPWADYRASTDPPEAPLRDLTHVVPDGET